MAETHNVTDNAAAVTPDTDNGAGNAELGWDSVLSDDGGAGTLVPAGVYDFEVKKCQRTHYSGGEKIKECPMAKLELELTAADGRKKTIHENIRLHPTLVWLLIQFFVCIGEMEEGQQEYRMDWSRVQGAKGRAAVGVRTFPGDDGKEHQCNGVDKYLPPEKGGDA